MDYFIADTHFGHENIINLDKRPFENAQENDKEIITRWNSVITPKDTVYILGDMFFKCSVEYAIDVLNTLKGKKILIVGNHDSGYIKSEDFCSCFEEIVPYKELRINKRTLVLCHYPILCFNGRMRNGIHFYGHVHNNSIENKVISAAEEISEEICKQTISMINVGAMCFYMNFTPRTFSELEDVINLFETKIDFK